MQRTVIYMHRALWYAEGFRWIGSLFTGAAEHFERSASRMAQLDPRVQRDADEYLDKVRTRSHLYG